MIELKAKMQAELANLPFINADFRLVEFNGGTVNSSYRLESGGKQYFVKTFESDEITLLDRQSLFNIQKQLAKQGVSVAPVYLSKINQFQIDHWVDQPTLDNANLPKVKLIKRLANILAKIHGLQIDAPMLDLPKQWQHYLSITYDNPVQASTKKYQNMVKLWQQSCLQNPVFCHNDLALTHITHADQPLVFDWEYCAISCRFFDLGSCIKVNDLNAADQASLCAYYAQFSDLSLSEVTKKVHSIQPLVDYTYNLWYQSANISQLTNG